MTDKIKHARRAAFEAALSLKNSQRQESGFDALRPEEARNMWWAFNAALDCVVIELPTCSASMFVTSREAIAAQAGVVMCADAIESTNLGIKVK